ncbi:MAG TPA: hypothetical protein VJX29_15060 [Candidatus Acidoferrales bacterium]|nr:hypothetical protein [Candidatus Acidoferrales bacterium]
MRRFDSGGESGRDALRRLRGARPVRRAGLFRLLAALLAVFAPLGLAGCGHSERAGEEAFAGDRNVTLWTSLAQVREPAATVRYGERVEIMERQNDQARVRTAAGVLGWTEQRNLIDSALWHRARDLAERARTLPVEARATTDKLTNVHIEPGRASPRIYQFRSGTPLEILGRGVADYARGGGDEGGAPAGGAAPPAETRHEDWALVRAKQDPGGEIAGWVLRRFVKYEIPPQLLDYSTQYRFVAWFDLNTVATGEPAPPPRTPAGRVAREAPGPPESVGAGHPAESGEKPQFLVAGIQGPEGQPCDFTLIRVYTWGAERQRYETAYVESNLCGSLPIRVQSAGAAGGNAEFAFTNRGRGGEERREYVMHQTSVRRTDNRRPGPHPARRAH